MEYTGFYIWTKKIRNKTLSIFYYFCMCKVGKLTGEGLSSTGLPAPV